MGWGNGARRGMGWQGRNYLWRLAPGPAAGSPPCPRGPQRSGTWPRQRRASCWSCVLVGGREEAMEGRWAARTRRKEPKCFAFLHAWARGKEGTWVRGRIVGVMRQGTRRTRRGMCVCVWKLHPHQGNRGSACRQDGPPGMVLSCHAPQPEGTTSETTPTGTHQLRLPSAFFFLCCFWSRLRRGSVALSLTDCLPAAFPLRPRPPPPLPGLLPLPTLLRTSSSS